MSMLDTPEKGECAIALVLVANQTAIPTENIFKSFGSQEETIGEDYVVISCQGGHEDGQNAGNERLTFSIQVRSRADADPDEGPTIPFDTHRANVGAVFDVLRSTTIHSELSAAVSNFHVFDSVTFRRGRNRTENRKFISEILLEMSCAPSDIS